MSDLQAQLADDGAILLRVPQGSKFYDEAARIVSGAMPIRYQKDQQLRNEILHAESQTNTSPTDKEKESGNYRKGKVNLHGLSIAIETPKGVERSGIGDDGKPWSIKMKNSYGYILGTNSKADSDHVDVFIGPVPESEIVFVIDQNKKDGTFDEHKAVVGTVSASDARALYLSNYEDGWDRLGGIKAMTIQPKQWHSLLAQSGMAPTDRASIKRASKWYVNNVLGLTVKSQDICDAICIAEWAYMEIKAGRELKQG